VIDNVVEPTPAQPDTALAEELYSLALKLAVTGNSLGDAAEIVRLRTSGDEAPIEIALTLAEEACRDDPLALASRQAMYVLGRALLTEST
jgi:hypothetical protein